MGALMLQLHLNVFDDPAFRASARDRALRDGASDEQAELFIDPERTSIAACAAMLFDPGAGPAGCEILEFAQPA